MNYNKMMKVITLSFVLFFTISSPVMALKIQYGDRFGIKINENLFTYRDRIRNFEVELNKCNKKIFRELDAYFSLKEFILPKIPVRIPSEEIFFLKDDKKVPIQYGSKLHLRLESMPKIIDGYISRAGIACK